MIKIFRRKEKMKFFDYDGKPLTIGDKVLSLRYELGKCIIVKGDTGFEYESIETGKRVSYAFMIDAHTENQKVRKIEE